MWHLAVIIQVQKTFSTIRTSKFPFHKILQVHEYIQGLPPPMTHFTPLPNSALWISRIRLSFLPFTLPLRKKKEAFYRATVRLPPISSLSHYFSQSFCHWKMTLKGHIILILLLHSGPQSQPPPSLYSYHFFFFPFLAYSSTLKMKAEGASEKLVMIYRSQSIKPRRL
jgi:hypothetical protein